MPSKYLTLQEPGKERINKGKRGADPAGGDQSAAAASIQPNTSASAVDHDDDDIYVDEVEEQEWLSTYI